MDKVKSSVSVPPWAGCHSVEHFTVFSFLITLINFKLYLGHLSVWIMEIILMKTNIGKNLEVGRVVV